MDTSYWLQIKNEALLQIELYYGQRSTIQEGLLYIKTYYRQRFIIDRGLLQMEIYYRQRFTIDRGLLQIEVYYRQRLTINGGLEAYYRQRFTMNGYWLVVPMKNRIIQQSLIYVQQIGSKVGLVINFQVGYERLDITKLDNMNSLIIDYEQLVNNVIQRGFFKD